MKNKYYILLVLIAFLASCTDKFEDFNSDNKRPAEVTGEALFSNAQKALADQISTPNVNLNVWRLFAQYWTETTYTDEANYDIVNRTIPDNTFQEYYRDILSDFRKAAELIAVEETNVFNTATDVSNKLQICELMEVYAFQDLVNMFGDIPYFEALDIDDLHPYYNDADSIYRDMIARVNSALDNLTASDNLGFGTADLIYEGDISKWVMFGNALKVKLGIVLADVDETLSRTTIESAASGVFASGEDDALFQYLGATPNTNQIYAELVLTGRHDFVAANTIVDIMNALDDPRRAVYFTMADTSTETGVVKPAYLGGQYGYSSPFSQYSHVADAIQAPDFQGILLTYDEVLFYLAEAAARGFNVGSAADVLYEQAITASFEFWGLPADSADVYLANADVAYDAANFEELIGTQSWLALYTRGLEGYTQWRRLDYPIFNIPEAWTEYSEIPVRFTYPVIEQTINEENYYDAVSRIEARVEGGGDDLTTRLFWDMDTE